MQKQSHTGIGKGNQQENLIVCQNYIQRLCTNAVPSTFSCILLLICIWFILAEILGNTWQDQCFQIGELQRENGLLSYNIGSHQPCPPGVFQILDILKTITRILKKILICHNFEFSTCNIFALAVYSKCPCVHRDSSQGMRSVLSGL